MLELDDISVDMAKDKNDFIPPPKDLGAVIFLLLLQTGFINSLCPMP